MNVEKLKLEIRKLFGEQIEFNKEFIFHAEQIKNIEENFLEWCKLVKEKQIKPISKSVLKENVVFIKKIGGSTRCIIIKIINGEFKEVHLGDHRYYDSLTKKLGLKKSSKRY
jgi:hypothetical protein